MAQITIADATPRVQYTVGSGGSTGPFTIPWPYFSTNDIKVYVDGVLKTITTHYTISGTAVDDGFSGGTITYGSTLTNVTVTVERDVAVERTDDFPAAGIFNIATLNTTLDKIFAIMQWLETKLARSVSRPFTSTESYSLNWPDGATTDPKVLVASSDAGLELGATSAEIEAAATKATEAASSAAAAASSATSAASAATSAASSSSTASGTATTLSGASSTTSLSIGTGSKAFTVASGLAFVAGDYVIATSNSGVSNYMHGQIASYSGTTLTLTSANTGGSGTKTDWTIRRSGPLGATGSQGPQGDTGPSGSGDMSDLVDDTSPQLGGDLDVNGRDITSASNADVDINPNGTGNVVLKTDLVSVGGGSEIGHISSNGAFDMKISSNSGTNSGTIVITDAANGAITLAPNGTGVVDVQGSMNSSISTTGKAVVFGF